jgi:hypothetical protein
MRRPPVRPRWPAKARNNPLITAIVRTRGERPPNTCLVACDMTDFGLVLLGWRSPES